MEDFINLIFAQGSYEGLTRQVQMSMVAAIVFIASVLIPRFAHGRSFGKLAPFDVILAFMIGSLLSRATNGRAPVFETLAVVFLIILLHGLDNSDSAMSHCRNKYAYTFRNKMLFIYPSKLFGYSCNGSYSRGAIQQ